MLTVKFALFLALQVFVVSALCGVVGLGVCQVVRDALRHSRPEPHPTQADTLSV